MRSVLGMVFSARTGGNLFDLAELLFGRLSTLVPKAETGIIEVSRYRVSPCNGCSYQCLLEEAPGCHCPIQDDAADLWRLALRSELLVYFIPTYGGMPAATWLAFQQRYHGVFRCLPQASGTDGRLAVVTIFEPLGTRAGDMSQSLVLHYLANEPRKLVSYEPIIPSNYGLNSLRDRLVSHAAVRSRMEEMSQQLARAI